MVDGSVFEAYVASRSARPLGLPRIEDHRQVNPR